DDSFLDLKEATIKYRSNNPAVASVDATGKVTAIKPRAASVFAEVTYNDKTVSSNYPVKVMPNVSPASITVNGKAIAGFNADVHAYSYLLGKNASVPVIKATAVDKNIVVEIEQAKGLPG